MAEAQITDAGDGLHIVYEPHIINVSFKDARDLMMAIRKALMEAGEW